MAYKIKTKLVFSEHKDYDYGYSDRSVYEVSAKWYTFICTYWSYHEYATEDEPSYDEASSDCICNETEDFVAEDKCDFTEDIKQYILDEEKRQKEYEDYLKETGLPF